MLVDSNLVHIPTDLRALPNWVCHRDKQPFNPRTGYGASHSDPRTWTTFPEAYAAWHRGYHGLGCAITVPYVGIDFDHCVDRATGAIDRWVAEWLARLDSYSEYSFSGTGIHTWVRAALDAACKTPRAELYGRARFFTMTGNRVLGTPAAIEARQDVVDALVAELRPVRSGAAITEVWTGTVGGSPATLRERAAAGRIRRVTLSLLDSTGAAGYGSASEADSALACALVGAGLTADEVLALFLDSPRGGDAIRRKSARHGESYLRRTVEHAARHVGPVLAPLGGLRVRLGNGAAVAWRLAGRPHGGQV